MTARVLKDNVKGSVYKSRRRENFISTPYVRPNYILIQIFYTL